jgi:hypothetical protein
VVGTRDNTEGSRVGGAVKKEKKSYLKDSCAYTHRVHIKDQDKEAVNWIVLDLLK